MRHFLFTTLITFCCFIHLKATIIAPPNDLGHLLELSEFVFYGEVIDHKNDNQFLNEFRILSTVKGNLSKGKVITLSEHSSYNSNGTYNAVSGDVDFQKNKRYLVFASHKNGNVYISNMMALSVYEEVEVKGKKILAHTKDMLNLSFVSELNYDLSGIYNSKQLIKHLKDIHENNETWAIKKAGPLYNIKDLEQPTKNPTTVYPDHCTMLIGDPNQAVTDCTFYSPGKFPSTSFKVRVLNEDPDYGSGITEVQNAITTMNAFLQINGSPIVQFDIPQIEIPCNQIPICDDGMLAYLQACQLTETQEIAITFGNHCAYENLLIDCVGVLGVGGVAQVSEDCPISFCGLSWRELSYPYLNINTDAATGTGIYDCLEVNGDQGKNGVTVVLIHEMLHAIGLGHIYPSDCTALLNEIYCEDYTQEPDFGLSVLDKECVNWVYGEPVACDISNGLLNMEIVNGPSCDGDNVDLRICLDIEEGNGNYDVYVNNIFNTSLFVQGIGYYCFDLTILGPTFFGNNVSTIRIIDTECLFNYISIDTQIPRCPEGPCVIGATSCNTLGCLHDFEEYNVGFQYSNLPQAPFTFEGYALNRATIEPRQVSNVGVTNVLNLIQADLTTGVRGDVFVIQTDATIQTGDCFRIEFKGASFPVAPTNAPAANSLRFFGTTNAPDPATPLPLNGQYNGNDFVNELGLLEIYNDVNNFLPYANPLRLYDHTVEFVYQGNEDINFLYLVAEGGHLILDDLSISSNFRIEMVGEILCTEDAFTICPNATAPGLCGTNFTYLWNDNSTNECLELSGLPNGSYCVTVTDDNNCSVEDCFEFGTPGHCQWAFGNSADNVWTSFQDGCEIRTCCVANDDLLLDPGLEDFDGITDCYWETPNEPMIPGCDPLVINNCSSNTNSSDQYTFHFNQCDTPYSLTFTVEFYDSPIMTLSGPDEACTDQEFEIVATTIGGTGPIEYRWGVLTLTGCEIIGVNDGPSFIYTMPNQKAFTICCFMIDANECTSYYEFTIENTLQVCPSWDVHECEETIVICADAMGGTEPYTYTWYKGEFVYSDPIPEYQSLCPNDYPDNSCICVPIGDPELYFVTVVDANGCEFNTSQSVQYINPEVNSIFANCSSDQICASAVGQQPLEYNWTIDGNPSNGASCVNALLGIEATYCVTITDPLGCQDELCEDIFMPNKPNCLIDLNQTIHVACDLTIPCGDCVTLIANMENSDDYTWVWSEGMSTGNTTEICPYIENEMVITATGTDVNGCVETLTFNLQNDIELSCRHRKHPSSVHGIPWESGCDIKVCIGDVLELGAVSNISGVWEDPNGEGNQGIYSNILIDNIQLSDAGPYIFTFFHDGCVETIVFNVDVVLPPSLFFAYPNECETPRTICVIPAGSAPFTYQWSTGGQNVGQNQCIQSTHTGGVAIYSVTVTDTYGCTQEAETVPVFVHETAECFSVFSAPPLETNVPGCEVTIPCDGLCKILIAEPQDEYSWIWLDEAGIEVGIGSIYQACPSESTTFTAQGTSLEIPGCTTELSFNVIVEPDPSFCQVEYYNDLIPTCDFDLNCGDCITLLANPGLPFIWTWDDGTTGSERVVCPENNTTYIVTGIDPSNGCIYNLEFHINVSDYDLECEYSFGREIFNFWQSPTQGCVIDDCLSDILTDLRLQPTNILSSGVYEWHDKNGNFIQAGPTLIFENLEPADSGDYTLVFENGSCTESVTFTIDVHSLNTEIAGPNVVCGEWVELEVFSTAIFKNMIDPDPAVSYEWDWGGNPVTTTQNPFIVGPLAQGNNLITLTITDGYGCTASDQISVYADNTIASCQVEYFNDVYPTCDYSIVCGDCITLHAIPGSPINWTWNDGTVGSEREVCPDVNTSYIATGIHPISGCVYELEFNIRVLISLPMQCEYSFGRVDFAYWEPATQSCVVNDCLSEFSDLRLQPTSIYNNGVYKWYNENGNLIHEGPSLIFENLDPTDNGVYTLVFGHGSCSDEITFTIDIYSLSTELIGPAYVCGPEVELDVVSALFDHQMYDPNPMVSYLWEWGAANNSSVIPDQSPFIIAPLDPGNNIITLTITDSNGCTASDEISVHSENINASCQVEYYNDVYPTCNYDIVCGDCITLRAIPGSPITWTWNDGDIGSERVVCPDVNTSYTVTGINPSSRCVYELEFNIRVLISLPMQCEYSFGRNDFAYWLPATQSCVVNDCLSEYSDLRLQPTVIYNNGVYNWYDENGNLIHVGPTLIFENLDHTDNGDYTLVFGHGNCADEITFTIDVHSLSTEITGPNMVCGTEVELEVLSLFDQMPDPNHPVTYSWEWGAANNSSAIPDQSPFIISPLDVGGNIITLTITDSYGCTASDQIEVYAHGFYATLEIYNGYCDYVPSAEVTTNIPDACYTWVGVHEDPGNVSSFEITETPPCPDDGIYNYEVTVLDKVSGCEFILDQEFTLHCKPEVTYTTNSIDCQAATELTIHSDQLVGDNSGPCILYSINGIDWYEGEVGVDYTFDIVPGQVCNLYVKWCEGPQDCPVFIGTFRNEDFDVTFDIDDYCLAGKDIFQITQYGGTNVTYEWAGGNPTWIYGLVYHSIEPAVGEYTYTLTATDIDGCVATAAYTFEVFDYAQVDYYFDDECSPTEMCIDNLETELSIFVCIDDPVCSSIEVLPGETYCFDIEGAEDFELIIKLQGNPWYTCWIRENITVPTKIEAQLEGLANHCNEEEVIAAVVANGGSGDYSYEWSTGDNSQSIMINEDIGYYLYYVTITDVQSTCSIVLSGDFDVFDCSCENIEAPNYQLDNDLIVWEGYEDLAYRIIIDFNDGDCCSNQEPLPSIFIDIPAGQYSWEIPEEWANLCFSIVMQTECKEGSYGPPGQAICIRYDCGEESCYRREGNEGGFETLGECMEECARECNGGMKLEGEPKVIFPAEESKDCKVKIEGLKLVCDECCYSLLNFNAELQIGDNKIPVNSSLFPYAVSCGEELHLEIPMSLICNYLGEGEVNYAISFMNLSTNGNCMIQELPNFDSRFNGNYNDFCCTENKRDKAERDDKHGVSTKDVAAKVTRVGNLQLSPNPVHELLNIKMIDFENEQFNLTVIDNKGQKIESRNGQTDLTILKINTLSYPQGVYTIVFSVGEKVITKRFIVVK